MRYNQWQVGSGYKRRPNVVQEGLCIRRCTPAEENQGYTRRRISQNYVNTRPVHKGNRSVQCLEPDKESTIQKSKRELWDVDIDIIDLDEEFIEAEAEEQKQGQKKRWKNILICMILLFAVAGLGFGIFYQLPYLCVKDSVTIEAGDDCPSVQDYLKWNVNKAFFVSDIEEGTELHVQDCEVVIHLFCQDVKTMLHIKDTIAPELQVKDLTIVLGDEFTINDFVENVSDVTECELFYKEDPNVSESGDYNIVLNVVDEGGNTTEAQAKLHVLQDVTSPVIEGVGEIEIMVGESVSYKRGITVSDDYDGNVALEIDNSKVDVDTPGDYPVVYSATDRYGNKTEIATVLHVKSKEVSESLNPNSVPVTEEAVNAEADKLLASITNPSMSQYEIIKAIYDWCHNKIAYVDGASKSSWVDGAYDGIVRRRGDCYTYAMTAKCLLNRAGITNMDIERIPVGNGMHFWNLVDIGEGWHHFDTCRRVDGSTFFYLTDAELMEYSTKHTGRDYPDGTHNYDRTLYPVIP